MGKKLFLAGTALLLCLFLSVFFASGAPNDERKNQKTIILTFDDGPRPEILKELLPLLEKYKIPATFFVVGYKAAKNKEWLKKIDEAGHQIENHSWGHENFKKLFAEKGTEAIKNSLRKTDATILNAVNAKPKFFRPPFWEINDEIERIVLSEGHAVMKLNNPDINTLDYEDQAKGRPPEVLIERVKKLIAKREQQRKFRHVLVFHELSITVKALEKLIPYFQKQNYEFVRINEWRK